MRPAQLKIRDLAGSRTFRSTSLAASLACVVLLTLLGHKPLADWDEGIYAEVSREMLSLGWLVPHFNLRPWFEKPPLEMWITAAIFKIFGISDFTARAASALSGVAIVALLHCWLARKRDLLAAWLSTITLLATLGFLHVCRAGETDVLLSLGCVIALIGLTAVDERDPTGWYSFWIGFAVAVMTKSAAALVLPPTGAAFAALQRWRRDRFARAFWLGSALFLLLVLPWHLMMFRLFGHRFLDQYLGLQVVTRTTQQIEEHVTPWWFYFKVVAVSAPTFALLYPFAIVHGLRRTASGSGGKFRVWAVFCLVGFGCFTLVQTRLPQYIAPAYPALALLTAVFAEDWLRPALRGRPVSYPMKLAVAATVACAAAYLLTAPARKSLHRVAIAHRPEAGNKDSIALLSETFRNPQPISGPLILWRQDPIASIATDVFYSRRQVQQVQLAPIPPNVPLSTYIFDPELLSQAVTSQPRLILLDKSLVPEIPSGFLYTPIEAGQTVELGTIVRRP
jgi:4-amino-4-deoxy-L-arabinose transferase-like glycosyltransferase